MKNLNKVPLYFKGKIIGYAFEKGMKIHSFFIEDEKAKKEINEMMKSPVGVSIGSIHNNVKSHNLTKENGNFKSISVEIIKK